MNKVWVVLKYSGAQRQKNEENVKRKEQQKKTNWQRSRRGKQRMQMRGESVAEMIAVITIIISMCCWQ